MKVIITSTLQLHSHDFFVRCTRRLLFSALLWFLRSWFFHLCQSRLLVGAYQSGTHSFRLGLRNALCFVFLALYKEEAFITNFKSSLRQRQGKKPRSPRPAKQDLKKATTTTTTTRREKGAQEIQTTMKSHLMLCPFLLFFILIGFSQATSDYEDFSDEQVSLICFSSFSK